MYKLYLPRLGQTMEKGTIQAWMKEEDDFFEVGDVLYEVETEKVVTEVEAKQPGTLARILVPVGEERPAGTVLAIAADPGEEPSEEEIEAAVSEAAGEVDEAAAEEAAEEAEVPAEAPARASGGKVRAMPKARALARELGVDLEAVEGTGRNGSITVGDVRAAADGARDGDGTGARGPRVAETRSLSGLGRTMAEVVARSWREIPQFVQMVELDAGALTERRRAETERAEGAAPSYTDLLIEAMVGAVEEEPLANASFAGGDEIVVYRDVHVSLAVATETGLVVPVVRRAQELSLAELASATRGVAKKAREGGLAAEDVEGGTITLSNLGMLGIEAGTPMVTAPQAAVVFAGAIVEKPMAVDGRVEIRPALTLSIGYDHRVLDGATAARFTTALRRQIEEPLEEPRSGGD